MLQRLALRRRRSDLRAPLEPKRVGEIDGVSAREAVEVEPAGEAEGIFLRETPDRTGSRRPERRKHAPLFFLTARVFRIWS